MTATWCTRVVFHTGPLRGGCTFLWHDRMRLVLYAHTRDFLHYVIGSFLLQTNDTNDKRNSGLRFTAIEAASCVVANNFNKDRHSAPFFTAIEVASCAVANNFNSAPFFIAYEAARASCCYKQEVSD